jgi:NAD(P)-dependent dehydrogenase (short-subunit alcohol dehydrogenase family)
MEDMTMRLKDKIAFVSGSGGGIGRGIGERFLKEGATVIFNDIAQEKLDNTINELKSKGYENCMGIAADVSESDQVKKLFASIVEKYGRIDILVNNVGIERDNQIKNMPDEDWDDVMKVNVRSYFLCCREASRIMAANGGGRIVNISSRAWLGGFGQSNYSASKGAIVSLTRTLAIELAKKNITVNCIAPGIITTPLFQSFPDQVKERLYKMQPMNKIGSPADIAYAALNFADDEAWYITGQIMYVCGGKSLSSYIG